MRLYHATLKSNLQSITHDGLLPEKAAGRRKAVWLHTKSKRGWAIAHTQQRHNATLDEIVIFEIEITRSRLTRRWRGLWTCETPITEFVSITTAGEFADSPIREDEK